VETPSPFSSVDQVCTVLVDERDGDVITALAHALQCGWLLTSERPDDVELQVAGLVHDIASSLEPSPRGDHAQIGASLVRELFGDRVADLVGGHVMAKRYLVTTDSTYRGSLSDESTRTLALQGDVLTDDERAAFEASPLAADWLQLRRADDRAKIPGLAVPTLDAWRVRLDALAAAH
jgi:predicted HD phosphohydrolase